MSQLIESWRKEFGPDQSKFSLGKHPVEEDIWPRTWANSKVPKEGNWDKVGRSRERALWALRLKGVRDRTLAPPTLTDDPPEEAP